MFNGIIKNTGNVTKIYKKKGNCVIEILSKMNFTKKEIGSSISCSGVCLTLEKFNKNFLTFFLSKETLKRSTFSLLKKGDKINLEKSLKFRERLSGHFVQGHVDTTSEVLKIYHIGRSLLIDFKILKKYKIYIVEKGSISINGVSLTIVKLLKDGFQISAVPHTLKLTNLINLKKKDIVNIEFDILGKYVNNFIKR
jgi:riboflavin synthase